MSWIKRKGSKLNNNSKIFKGVDDSPALSIFVWQDGTGFDQIWNNYMSAPYTQGIDPRNPAVVRDSFPLLGNLTTLGSILTGNVSSS